MWFSGLSRSGRALLTACAGAGLFLLLSCDSSPTAPTPPELPPTCAYQLTGPAEPIGSEGGTASVTVSTAAQCSWTARVEAAWITITAGGSGTGPGTVTLTASANSDTSSREVSITVADQSTRVGQRGRAACEFAVTPDQQRFGPDGGSGSIAVTTAQSCAWTATATESWVTLSTAAGSGSGRVDYTVAPHSGSGERAASIRIADRTVNLRQDPVARECQYSAGPADIVLHWHETGGQVQVVTEAGCRWTSRSTADWLTFPEPENREGPGSIALRMDPYSAESTRKAALEVRWPTPSAGQNVWVTQEGCYYAIGASTRVVDRAGGNLQVMVFGTPRSANCMVGCPWTATSSVPWIRIARPNGVGDDMLFYVVDPNPGPSQRVGTISVGTHTLTITQTF